MTTPCPGTALLYGLAQAGGSECVTGRRVPQRGRDRGQPPDHQQLGRWADDLTVVLRAFEGYEVPAVLSVNSLGFAQPRSWSSSSSSVATACRDAIWSAGNRRVNRNSPAVHTRSSTDTPIRRTRASAGSRSLTTTQSRRPSESASVEELAEPFMADHGYRPDLRHVQRL
jgi:hypothetical protein